ncbi:MAG: threonine--tRNA ligase [Actinomycetota bacterium]|nr:threonine--tRNA ligase [Actinomycetota bacterium]
MSADGRPTARERLAQRGQLQGRVVAALVTAGSGPPQEWDLDRPVPDDAQVEPVQVDTDRGRAILRHSVAHLMAQAVTQLYPHAKFAIGPPVEDGFYYDFEVDQPFTPDDLERIEERMRDLVREKQRFERDELPRDEALQLFADQPYKREIIERLDPSEVEVVTEDGRQVDHAGHGQTGDTVTVYRNVVEEDGEVKERWADLCRGPHLPNSGWVPAFKLLRTAGAYWRGDESRPMLQRIYGTAWESRRALDEHLRRLEEARERDHRKLGPQLELVHFAEELGPGMAIWLPKGAIVRKQMEDWARDEHLRRGYQPVYTPHLAKGMLWETSGHLDYYRENMFPAMQLENLEYYAKPMNCPFHILAYQSKVRSYRELPLRLAELGTVYRFEKSGVVNAMLRARGFTQDDSHIFCTRDQVVDEVVAVIRFTLDLYRDFGFGRPSRVAVSTRPEKAIGRDEDWDVAEKALVDAVQRAGLEYQIDAGEGAFYGPKIDMHARDAIGREWQLTTIQVDFNLPERFDVTYVGEDGQHHRPFMIHRALFGSVERFFAVMLESFNGAFPLWLAPVQVAVIPVAADFVGYAHAVADAVRDAGMRVEVDDSDDTLGNKIRKGQIDKIPYLAVVGGREEEARTVSVRPYQGDQRARVGLAEWVTELTAEVRERRAGAPSGG